MKQKVKWMFAAILFVGTIGAKALVMTHAYSNAVLDKVEEAVKNGIVGNEDDDW